MSQGARERGRGKEGGRPGKGRNPLVESLAPLVVDVGVPLGSYYVLSDGFGMGTVAALAWSSAVPALRTVWSVVKERRINGMAALILAVNVIGLLLSTVTGDPRLMLAKDSGVSSVIGIVVLVTACYGRPLMTPGLRAWVVKGSPAKQAAWDDLLAGSARFRRAERTFSAVWGAALLTECVARVVGAYTIPIDTMVWLGTVMLVVAIVAAMVVSGGMAVDPMERMVAEEVARRERAAGEDGAGEGGAGALGGAVVPEAAGDGR
ncbi:VC0807 family protein [Streptomyces sp. NPDC003077]|uniref:VC0807 family protein n=1 Tax=Streptomyces sp. NPDC003077 TaxID=3154443 RepID=UPI0033B3C26F